MNNTRKFMVINLLVPILFVIFTLTAYNASGQMLQMRVCKPDTVATIYVLQYRGEQTVQCYTYYDIQDVQAAVVEFFNAVLYPHMTQHQRARPKGFRIKKT